MEANNSAILAELLKARGLSVTNQADGSLTARNPLHPHVREAVGEVNGSYVTDYGYELGEHGDELATADRVAFLLGLPAQLASTPASTPLARDMPTDQPPGPGSPVIAPGPETPDHGREDPALPPRHAAPPDENQQAMSTAEELVNLLAIRHNIPAHAQPLPSGVVVSVYAGLVVHVDHIIWWPIPDVTGARPRPLMTYACTPAGAASRLAQHYLELRSVPLRDLLAAGFISPIAAGLLDETEARHAAATV